MGFLFAAAAAHFAAFLSDEDGWVKNKQIDGTNYLRQRGEERKRGLRRGGGAGSVFSDATGGRIDLLEGSAPILPSGAFPFK